ncbi:MAG TPA: T9SS type A sorting domain-containing protein, partial [Bacteroidota bacterium]|nr:T9SS type A sorting domain-containing protein [Bacteroidota bacterium]
YVYAIAVSGNNLVASTSYGGIFLSTDSGTSWTGGDTGLVDQFGQTPGVSAFAVSGSSLFAGTYVSGVFLSTNDGTSWTAVNSGLTDSHVTTLVLSGTSLFAGTGSGVFRSTDRGANWTVVSSGLPKTDFNSEVLALAVSGTNLFAGTRGYGIFRSTDGGASWTPVDSGLTNSSVQVLAVSPTSDAPGGRNLFAGTYSGVFRSTDDGARWMDANSGLTNNAFLYALGISPASDATGRIDLFAGTNYGVFRSTNSGIQWTVADFGIDNESPVFAIAVSGNNIIAGSFPPRGGQPDNGGIYVSSNSGTTWAAPDSGLPHVRDASSTYVSALAVSGTNLFAAVEDNRGEGTAGIFRSTNGGTTWSEADAGLVDQYRIGPSVNAIAISGTHLLAGTESSSDGPFYLPGGVYLSTNNGTSWTAANSGLASTSVRALAVSGTNLFAGTANGVFISTNDAASWTAVDSGLTSRSVRALVVSPVPDGKAGINLFAGTDSDGVFLSTNSGTNWTSVNTGLPKTSVSALAASGGNVFAGTEASGVWRRPLSEMITSVEGSSAILPMQFTLAQNYPNPFNPTTSIRYAVPSRTHVTLSVYNTLGQLVSTLVNGEEDPGFHEVRFDGSNLASGVYFYRIQAGIFTQARRLLHLK